MASLLSGFEYDIFISYRQKDNKHDGWVTEFVDQLKGELESTFKEDISVYFDINPHDGLLETHDVYDSLKDKLNCLVFIPVISRTYCDPRSFAWEHEFKAFIEQATDDQFGLKVKLPDGNVANRVLPVRIHDLDNTDINLCNSLLGGFLRGVEFIYKSPGVNRPLRAKEENPHDNFNHTIYRDQINKVALAIRDLVESLKAPAESGQVTDIDTLIDIEESPGKDKTPHAKKHNLPTSTTSFIGREREIKEVRELVHNSRLVTLTGAGGCGKTRLAREIASTFAEEYKAGVWFSDLSPITDPNLVTKKIAEVLNIHEEPNKPVIDTLIENIKNKSLLILLDNCEHLIQVCAEIADKLLHSVQDMRILATSREALNIPGEVVWRIPTLSFPDGDSIMEIDEINRYEAIKLFIDRAGSVMAGFTLNHQNVSVISQICRRLDGIPLAIELAATRIRHLGPETILERLEDQFNILSSSSRITPERQQTLKAAIDWSYNLLSGQEQLLFNRLSVFPGDFSLEAMEEVSSDEKLVKGNIITVISQLVDKSLVIAENQENESLRYRCLVPLQQYGLQKLIGCGEEENLRKSHLSYFLKFAELAYEELFESQLKWMNKLEMEHDNLITALNWSYNNSTEEFIRLSGALAWFWRGHSHIVLGKNYLDKALSNAVDKNEAYARVLFGMAMILIYSNDLSIVRIMDLMNKSLTIWRKFKNLREEAWAICEMGELYTMKGDYESGLKYNEQSLQKAKRVGSPGLINHCLLFLCEVLVYSKQYDRGRALLEELLITSEKLEYIWGIENARHLLGDCAQGTKNFRDAEKLYALTIETSLKYGFIWLAICDIQGVAFALSGQSRWAKSVRLDAAAREKIRTIGGTLDGLVPFWDEWIVTYLGGARKEVGTDLTKKYEEEGKKMGFEAAIKYALDFEKD